MNRTQDRISVPRPDQLGDGADLSLAATICLPDHLADDPVVLVCWPGGSYDRTYWDLEIPGHTGYSFAEHATALGAIVVAIDPLGVGASERPEDGGACTLVGMGAVANAAVRRLRQRLADGTIDGRLVPAAEPVVVGVGHSLGAALAIVEQSNFATYDALCLLGMPPAALRFGEEEADSRDTAIAQAKAIVGEAWDGPGGFVALDKAPMQAVFNGPNVPPDIVAFDNASTAPWPVAAIVDIQVDGLIGRAAHSLGCPIFLGLGAREVLEPPHEAMAAFPSSHDVTLYLLAEAFHCHNFQARRTELWNRVFGWADAVRASRRAAGGQDL